jgi:hypothetical protein
MPVLNDRLFAMVIFIPYVTRPVILKMFIGMGCS